MKIAILIFVCIAVASCNEISDEEWLLPPEEWPTTCDDAAKDALSFLSWWNRFKIKRMEQSEMIEFHHGWGMGLRNRYGLWRGNEELIISCLGELGHPDSASTEIMKRVWSLNKGK